MIRAALFDMDGTIFDTERIYTQGWLAGAAQYGYPLTEEMLIVFHGQSPEENCRNFKSLFGEDARYWDVRAVRRKYVEDNIARLGVPVKPGLYQILPALKERGIRICIATASVRERAEAMWEETGIKQYIDFSVCGDEVTACKPNPEIFLAAAERCGALPEECIVLEDAANGIRAAYRAGAHPILIPDTEPVTDEMRKLAGHIFPSLADVCRWIESGGLDEYL